MTGPSEELAQRDRLIPEAARPAVTAAAAGRNRAATGRTVPWPRVARLLAVCIPPFGLCLPATAAAEALSERADGRDIRAPSEWLPGGLDAPPEERERWQEGLRPRTYAIEGFRVRLEMAPDGTYQVEESIDFTYSGGTYSQGYRSISTQGLDRITGVEVTSPQTQISEVDVRERGRSIDVTWSFEARDDPATFQIRYVVEGALQGVGTRNRIAWDAVGRSWDVPIQDLEVLLIWPEFGLEEEDIAFVPSDEGVLQARDGRWEVRFAREGLDAGVPYGVQVAFPRQLEGRAAAEPRGDPGLVLLALLLGWILGIVPAVVVAVAWRHSPDPSVPVPEGPPSLPVAQAGYLSAGVIHWGYRVFTAMLVDLARRGHVTLMRRPEGGASRRERPTGAGGLGGGPPDSASDRLEVVRRSKSASMDSRRPPDAGRDSTASRETSAARWRGATEPGANGLSELEARFLDAMEEHDSFQEFLAASPRFQTRAYRDTRRVMGEAGLLAPNLAVSRRTGYTAVLGAVGLAGAAVAASGPVAWGLGAAAVTLLPTLLLAAVKARWRRTERGARARAHLRWYQDRIRRQFEDAVERDPGQGARILAEHLPWMLLDRRLRPRTVNRLEQALKGQSEPLELPGWLRSALGMASEGGAETTDDGFLALIVVFMLMHTSRPQRSGSSTSGMPSRGFTGGAGVSTGVGGGGGGMR